MLIQATSAANMSARVAKIQSKPEASAWLKAGGAIEVWGWIKRGNRWRVKIVALAAEDMRAVVVAKPGRKPHGCWAPAALFSSDA